MVRGLGTRHRAAIGISKESDAIAVVVSEETGKVSIAKDGTLIVDVEEDALKRILMKNLVTDRFGPEEKKERFSGIKGKMSSKKDKIINYKKTKRSNAKVKQEDKKQWKILRRKEGKKNKRARKIIICLENKNCEI